MHWDKITNPKFHLFQILLHIPLTFYLIAANLNSINSMKLKGELQPTFPLQFFSFFLQFQFHLWPLLFFFISHFLILSLIWPFHFSHMCFTRPMMKKNSSKQMSCKNYQRYCCFYAHLKKSDTNIYKQK